MIDLIDDNICFSLNEQIVTELIQVKVQKQPFILSESFRQDLTIYLQNIGSYSFLTYYNNQLIWQTRFFFNGQIIHQVSYDFIRSNSRKVLEIGSVHHWLIEQVLQQIYPSLPPRKIRRIHWLSWVLSVLITGVFFLFVPVNYLTIIAAVPIFLGSQFSLKQLLPYRSLR